MCLFKDLLCVGLLYTLLIAEFAVEGRGSYDDL